MTGSSYQQSQELDHWLLSQHRSTGTEAQQTRKQKEKTDIYLVQVLIYLISHLLLHLLST